ncbi:hypothetical protein [Neisseria meningitidis]|nr:hypothetical protein [Neisseria meningitidis]
MATQNTVVSPAQAGIYMFGFSFIFRYYSGLTKIRTRRRSRKQYK